MDEMLEGGGSGKNVFVIFLFQLIYTIVNWLIFDKVDDAKNFVWNHQDLINIFMYIYLVIALVWILITILEKPVPMPFIFLIATTISLSYYISATAIGLFSQRDFLPRSLAIALVVTLGLFILAYVIKGDLLQAEPLNFLAGPWATAVVLLIPLVLKSHDIINLIGLIVFIVVISHDLPRSPVQPTTQYRNQ